jgi:hypothetical protein
MRANPLICQIRQLASFPGQRAVMAAACAGKAAELASPAGCR